MAEWRIAESVAGFRQLLQLLAEHAERIEQPIPVAIETAKGLLPAALRAAGYQLFPINPLAVSRYRDRHVAAGPWGVLGCRPSGYAVLHPDPGPRLPDRPVSRRRSGHDGRWCGAG